jgi:phenylpropionate dioxygenase-like ring-hydroxylating dioxygenase large terminal subunit
MPDTMTMPPEAHGFSTANPEAYRFPFPPFPNGWFPVALSHEVAKGDVLPVHRLGRDYVVYRTEDGTANVVGAYCPHLGAHLGFGGKIVGNDIRCPFHHWRFGLDGRCTGAYGTRKTPRGKLETPLVRERNGAIFIWHDAKGREPFWEIPELEETVNGEYRLVPGEVYTLRSHPQEAFENQPDVAHLITLHGYDIRQGAWDCDDISTSLTLDIGGHDTESSSWTASQVNVRAVGPSFNYSRFQGQIPAISLFMYSPTSAGILYNPVIFWVHKSIPDDTAHAWSRFIIDLYVGDLPVWEHKQYLERPMLTENEAPIAKMREWYRRWYE